MAEGAQEAAERLAANVAAGNLALVLADIAPEALAKAMQANPAAAGGAGGLPALPAIREWHVEPVGDSPAGPIFRLRFHSDAGDAVIETTWGEVMGQWKVVDFAVVELRRREPPSEPPSGS